MGHLLHQAVDAFANGDQMKAEKLLEQVRFLIELLNPAISSFIRTYVESSFMTSKYLFHLYVVLRLAFSCFFKTNADNKRGSLELCMISCHYFRSTFFKSEKLLYLVYV